MLKAKPLGIPCKHTPPGVKSAECKWCRLYQSNSFLRNYWDRPRIPSKPLVTKANNSVPVIHGPGTELKGLLVQLQLVDSSNCECKRRATQMDIWGPEGCRKNHDQITKWLRKEQAKLNWIELLKASSLAVTSGLAFKLNPLDPAPGLLDEAIRRAEAKINNAQGHKPSENSAAGTAEGNHV